MTKLQTSQTMNNDITALISAEILSSLLQRFKMAIDEKLKSSKKLLRRVLVEKEVKFLQEYSLRDLRELVQLMIFYGVHLGFISEPLNLANVNIIQFMFEIKNRISAQDPDFAIDLWKILKD